MRYITYIVLILAIIGCRTDRPPIDINPIIVSGGSTVIIANEGNYQYGNASISIYDPISNSSNNSYYESVNSSKLGDVCQSINFINGKAYIVVNNSSKIVVVDENSFEWEADILGFISPRYMLPITNAKALVTELFTDSIALIDLNEAKIEKRIYVGGETEKLHQILGKAFITSPNRGMVYILNTMTLDVVDSVQVGIGASSICEDAFGNLWVLCNGGTNGAGSLYCISSESHSVLKSFEFQDESKSPWRLCMNESNDTMYFLNESVYRMGIEESTLPLQSFITSQSNNFYSLNYDPQNKVLYVGDAVDFIQKGTVYVYDRWGSEKTNFKSGIIPGEFYFK